MVNNIQKGYRKGNRTDYLLMFILIATSGITFFYSNQEWIFIGLIISIFVLNKRKLVNKIDKGFLVILFSFIIWEYSQFIYNGGFSITPILGTATRLIFAYSVIKNVNIRFFKVYVEIIFFLSIISLLFYILFFISPGLTEILVSFSKDVVRPAFSGGTKDLHLVRPNIIFFTFYGFDLLPKRNSGPFWEPGAFAIFLNFAILFNCLIQRKFNWKENFIFIIALITTFSTTGFLVFFFIIFSYYFLILKKNVMQFVTLLPLFFLLNYLTTTLEFMAPKVQTNIELAESTTTSRFGSALADYYLFEKNPIMGYGRNQEALYGKSDVMDRHRNNGLARLFVQWGFIFACLYLFLVYLSFRKIQTLNNNNGVWSIIFFISFLLCAFSQGILQYPLFMSLMFLKYVGQKKSIKVGQVSLLAGHAK